MKEVPVGKPRTSHKVLDFLNDHPHQNVTVRQVAKATGLAESQVQAAVYSLRSRNKMPIATILRGQMWKYEPPGGPTETTIKNPVDEITESLAARPETTLVNSGYVEKLDATPGPRRSEAEVASQITRENEVEAEVSDAPFYQVGVSKKTGDLILESDTGTFYRAIEL